jgi:hypothetical protein
MLPPFATVDAAAAQVTTNQGLTLVHISA